MAARIVLGLLTALAVGYGVTIPAEVVAIVAELVLRSGRPVATVAQIATLVATIWAVTPLWLEVSARRRVLLSLLGVLLLAGGLAYGVIFAVHRDRRRQEARAEEARARAWDERRAGHGPPMAGP